MLKRTPNGVILVRDKYDNKFLPAPAPAPEHRAHAGTLDIYKLFRMKVK